VKPEVVISQIADDEGEKFQWINPSFKFNVFNGANATLVLPDVILYRI